MAPPPYRDQLRVHPLEKMTHLFHTTTSISITPLEKGNILLHLPLHPIVERSSFPASISPTSLILTENKSMDIIK